MKTIYITLAAMGCMFCVGAEECSKEIAAQNMMDCSNMSMEMQKFANQLNPMNKKMFCGQFTDAQRSSAMQYASQPDSNGKMMTADQAVQKVSSENNMMPTQKTPTGCPIK